MQQSFTRQFMNQNRGCYTEKELFECSFMNWTDISLRRILTSEIPLRDKYWFVCKILATTQEKKVISIIVAEIVLPIYEHQCIEYSTAPRMAIDAAKKWMDREIEMSELEKRCNIAATAALYFCMRKNIAYAAYAAAYAAQAVQSFYIDTCVVGASSAAIYAADGDDAITKQLYDYLLTFCGQ